MRFHNIIDVSFSLEEKREREKEIGQSIKSKSETRDSFVRYDEEILRNVKTVNDR